MSTISTPADLALVITRTFDAPRERVFQAWTDPKQIPLWMGTDMEMQIPSAKVDLRVGGKFRIQMQKPDGEYFTAAGEYREIKAPERLVFTWDWEKDGSEADFGELEGNTTLMTLEFVARGKQTELTLKHEKFATRESRDKHEHGWTLCLSGLEKFIQSK